MVGYPMDIRTGGFQVGGAHPTGMLSYFNFDIASWEFVLM